MNEITMEAETNSDVPQQNPFMLFFLVFVFFGTGLIGFLICHVLKKKGYRCRTSPEDLDSDIKEALNEEQENEVSNEDTVERIVKCIIQNEANTEALKQMLGENEGEALPAPRFRVTHIGKKHSLQGSQDDTNASSEPISSDKDPEDESWSKSKNGLATQETHEKGSLPLSINGPEMVGLAKMEFQRESEIKCVENNGLKKLENKIQKTTAKTKVSKERRSSAPEQTVTQRQKGNMKIDEHKQKRPIATVNPIQQVSKETSSQKQ
ncbi:RELT 2 [Pelobates cultripes]|uniref:RELT 2 n=1 Tax=Pelobates cultripes TaxID=61616 RepID=A0AAD1RPM0_PELCU|nr:RELT 2 [Pelobates cultripes]